MASAFLVLWLSRLHSGFNEILNDINLNMEWHQVIHPPSASECCAGILGISEFSPSIT